MGQKQRPKWQGSLGFLLAAAGSAVGLGNIWKFPYIVGMNGGGAFVFVYLGCIALVGIPILLSELYIGQKGQANAVVAFEKVDKKGSPWRISGFLGLLSAFLILSFYSVIGGWILDFEFRSLFNEFGQHNEEAIQGMLLGLFNNPSRQLFCHGLFMAISVAIVWGGVQKGIERWNKILMPGLVLLLAFLFVYSLFLPGFDAACRFIFLPDFNKLSAKAILEAVGHSFFTLSVAVGVMITYGSYLSPKENLPRLGFSIAIFDTVVALMAGVVIFAAVFSYGIEAKSGPTLIFQTLPALFNKMPGGYFIAIIFFLLIAFTAFTSSISILEVVVAYGEETWKKERKKVTVQVGLAAFLVGIPSALSTNLLADLRIVGFSFFDFLDKLTSTIFLPVSGLVTSLFIGWKLGPAAVNQILEQSGFEKLKALLLLCTRFIAPLAITIILYFGLDWVR